MKLEEFQRLGQTVKTFTSKLHENPGKFVAIVTQMYWDMKSERDTLINDLKVLIEKNEKLERELSAALNGELIKYDELQEYVLELQSELMECQKENEKLNNTAEEALDIAERENEDLNYTKRIHLSHIRFFSNNNELLRDEVKSLKKENKALRLQSNTYFDEWQNVKNMYTTLTDHIRLKASANPGVDRYIALVNFIDRLEKGEN